MLGTLPDHVPTSLSTWLLVLISFNPSSLCRPPAVRTQPAGLFRRRLLRDVSPGAARGLGVFALIAHHALGYTGVTFPDELPRIYGSLPISSGGRAPGRGACAVPYPGTQLEPDKGVWILSELQTEKPTASS